MEKGGERSWRTLGGKAVEYVSLFVQTIVSSRSRRNGTYPSTARTMGMSDFILKIVVDVLRFEVV